MPPILGAASRSTAVLFVHAPYPGSLRFEGQPTSLLYAATPFLRDRAALSASGLLDPGNFSEAFLSEFRALLEHGQVRALCISTSTVAASITAQLVLVAREVRGEDLLVIVGGPHEDDSPEKFGRRVPGVDLSLGGEAEEVLRVVLLEYLAGEKSPAEFVAGLPSALLRTPPGGGAVELTSRWFQTAQTQRLELGPLPAATSGRAWSAQLPRFQPFGGLPTMPLMVSRGCSYGRCTFCAEASRGGGVRLDPSFEWLSEAAAIFPGSPLYFQDSIFPAGQRVETELLPLLRELGRPWGAQIYLRTITRPWIEKLAQHGCTYLYTGLETSSPDLLLAVGKRRLAEAEVLERLRWMRGLGIQVGLSLMFGVMNARGELVETIESVRRTLEFTSDIRSAGVNVSGFYPNVQTVLPGTTLAKGIETAGGRPLDYYDLPRTPEFAAFEDGGVGHNFLSFARATGVGLERAEALGRFIAAECAELQDPVLRSES